jgi:multiple sugar transport system substrate-binding protein
VALALILSACGVSPSSGQSNELSDGPVTLRIGWWGGDNRHNRTQQAIDLFEQEHPNITVKPEFSDWTGYWDKLATSTSGGNAPDVIQMDQLYLASYAARGSLADLGSLSQLDTSNLDETVLGTGRWDGTLYAMPISTTSYALMVNTDLVKSLGTPLPDTSTWTWKDYQDWARGVTDTSGGAVRGTGVLGNEYSLQLFARQQGDQLFSTDDITITPETLADYFQMALDWTKSGAAPDPSVIAENLSLALDQGDFARGKTPTAFNTSSLITAYTAASGANIELEPLPTPDGNAGNWDYFKPGMYWSVSSRSEHPAEAALLVDFLVNDTDAAKVLGTERGIPANPDVIDVLAPTLTPEETKAVAFAKQRAPMVGDAPAIVPNGASDIETVLRRYEQDVLFGRQTPQDAAKAMIAEVKSAIAAAD